MGYKKGFLSCQLCSSGMSYFYFGVRPPLRNGLYFQSKLQYKLSGSSLSCSRENSPCPRHLLFTGHENLGIRSIIPPQIGGLILKIYETDPFCCPKCSGEMKISIFIEDPEIIKHLDLWDLKSRFPPKRANAPPPAHIDYSARPGAAHLYVQI